MPLAQGVKRRRYCADPDAEVFSLRQQRSRLRRRVLNLQQQLARMRTPKGACPVPMLTTVALSYPPANARAFARSLRYLLPKGQADWLHRKRIDAIRDAFVHVAKQTLMDQASSAIAAAARAQLPAALGAQGSSRVAGAVRAQLPAAVGAQGPEHMSVAFLHIHDESTLRLRFFFHALQLQECMGPFAVSPRVCRCMCVRCGRRRPKAIRCWWSSTPSTTRRLLPWPRPWMVSCGWQRLQCGKAWRQPLLLPGRCGLCTCLSGTVSRRTPHRRASCWRFTCSPLWRRASVTC